jgi:hypothetical protein
VGPFQRILPRSFGPFQRIGWDRFSVDNLLHQQAFPQGNFPWMPDEDLLK